MRSLITICILLMGLASRSVGQSYVGGAGMVNAGYMWSPALASSLHSSSGNALKFRRGYAVIGAEINYRNDRMVLLVSGYIGTQEARPADDRFAEPFMLKAHAGFGWIAFRRKSLFIYPVAGVGAMESSLSYHTITDSEVHILTKAPSMDVSIHADYFLDEVRGDRILNVGMVGLRAGYTRALSSSPLPGWNVTISVGCLAFMKNKRDKKI